MSALEARHTSSATRDPADRRGEVTRAATPRLLVECVAAGTLLGREAAWADLCRRALEPNIFLEPAFALPLLLHARCGRPPRVLLVWEDDDATAFGRLVGLLPLSAGRTDSLWRGYVDPLVCLGGPLLDRDAAAPAWDAALAWLAGAPTRSALSLTMVPRDGAVFRRLLEPEVGGRCRIIEERRRACLRAAAPLGPVACLGSAKRRKEARRQRRRLAERGTLMLVSARTPEAVHHATERFLSLENAGWKGGRGALLADPRLATFTRAMTRLMAEEGKCRIDSLEIDGRTLAMGIILTAHGRAHFWKTAFDEGYRPLSPGVQLALEITEAQRAAPDVGVTDSCAAPDHPMIDRIWPDRLTLVDCLVDLRPGEPGRFARVYARERLGRAAWRTGKALLKRLRPLATRVRILR